jgi:hypothetical protein
MKQATLDDVMEDLLALLQAHEGILITKSGKPAGVLKGFASEDECYDYLLQHDPELLQRLFSREATQP